MMMMMMLNTFSVTGLFTNAEITLLNSNYRRKVFATSFVSNSCYTSALSIQFLLGLYWSSALAEIRPCLQIQLISGSGQNWAGFQILPDLENFH